MFGNIEEDEALCKVPLYLKIFNEGMVGIPLHLFGSKGDNYLSGVNYNYG